MASTSILPTEFPAPSARGGYLNCVRAACGHAVQMMVRRQRIIFASIICMLPVLLPLALAFLSKWEFAEDGREQFIRIGSGLYVTVLSPLLALFFATMLVGEEAESQTMPYLLTRGAPRSAWVLGRFFAYVLVTGCLVSLAMSLTFAACTTLERLGWSLGELKMLGQFLLAAIMGLIGYGALTAFLGAVSKRPILIGVVLIYGWQSVAITVKGLLENLTIRFYLDRMIPGDALLNAMLDRPHGEGLGQLEAFNREIYLSEAAWSVFTLFCIAAVFLGLTVVTVRVRQYAAVKAAGA